MPVRPEELKRPVELILDDRTCRGCGYHLRGLKTDAKCPECGRPIRARDAARFADQMMQAPFAWLRRYVGGTFAMFAGGWLMIVGLLAWDLFAWPGWGCAALIGSAIWTVGVWVATNPRPKTQAMAGDPSAEWRWLRAWARASQPLWIPGIALGLTADWSGSASVLLIVPASMCVLAAVIGWWPLMAHQANLAHWASDTSLAGLLRIVSWSVGPRLVISRFGLGIAQEVRAGMGGAGAMGLGPLSTLGGTLFFLVAGVVVVGTTGHVLLALWRLWRMAHWAALAHMSVQVRDDRLRSRARNAAQPQSRGRSP